MRQAMEGTFFDRWLLMSGWGASSSSSSTAAATTNVSGNTKISAHVEESATSSTSGAASLNNLETVPSANLEDTKKRAPEEVLSLEHGPEKRMNVGGAAVTSEHMLAAGVNITGQAELERLIRAVASNPSLTALQKNTTIQGLRDSVWKSNQRQRQASEQQTHSFAETTTVLTRYTRIIVFCRKMIICYLFMGNTHCFSHRCSFSRACTQ